MHEFFIKMNDYFQAMGVQGLALNSFIESFKSGVKIWTKKKSGYTTKVKSELYNIIYNMQSEYVIPYSNSSVIQPAIDYIHSNYFKDIIWFHL